MSFDAWSGIAKTILDGFDRHYALFRQYSRAGHSCFEQADWQQALLCGGNTRFGKRVCHVQAADPGNGLAKPHQFLPIELVGSAEVVDDFGDRFSSYWVALVVCELEIFDDGAVFIGAFCFSEIHVY